MATNEFTLDASFEPLKPGWQFWLCAYVLGFGSLVVLLLVWGSP